MKLLRTGKVKEVYDAGPNELLFRFTNNISVFDKVIPSQIPRKGESLNRTSEFWFQRIEAEGICRTHYRSRPKADEMTVEKVQVIADYDKLNEDTTGYLIPIEVICRHYAAGSLLDRLEDGRLTPDVVGLDAMPEKGEPLPKPFIEFTTKLEKVDRPISEAEALEMSGLTEKELDHLKDVVRRIDVMIEEHVAPRGLIHADGKKEFAFDAERNLMIVDTFGTLDEDRWWEADAYAKGELVERSKEFVRAHYRETGYHEELEAARKAGEPEPAIPALPEDVVQATAKLYAEMFERITGEPF